jgi:L-seryl-tRNA(Ser) seleniumtransferase
VLAISAEGMSADELLRRLRAWDTPIIARVEEGRVLLDLRTVFPEQDEIVVQSINQAFER